MFLAPSPLRTAVIGVGALGRHHARILSTLPGIELVAVADPNVQQGRAVAEAAGCDWTDDFRTLFGTIDAASIAVPTSLHCEVASELLRRSVHVLVEKPLASTPDEGEVLLRLAEEHRVTLQVGHIERFNPAFQELADWTDEPKYIRTERYSPYPFRSLDIGVVLDLMVHDVDLVLSLTGECPVNVEAFGVSLLGGHEDCAQARLYFPGGCVADLSVNRVCPSVTRSMQVWSRRGCAIADLQNRTVSRFSAGLALQAGQLPYELACSESVPVSEMKEQMFGRFISVEQHQASNADALTMELSEFASAVRDGSPTRVDGRAGLLALRVAHEILERIDQHCWNGTQMGPIGPHVLIDRASPPSQSRRRAA